MKKQLYLLTTDFPYGRGENSFIMPELPYLKEEFDITIISNSLENEQTVVLDEDIQVIHHNRNVSILWKLWDSICFFASKDAYIELWDILKSGDNIGRCFFESLIFFEEARRFERFLRRNKVIDSQKEIIIYNYWFTYYCLSTTRLWGKESNVKIVTRAHRFDLYDEGYCGGRQPFKKQMDKKLDGVVFIAEHGRKYYLKKYGKNESDPKYRLFRLGVIPCRKKNEKDIDDNVEFLLVSCSIIIPRKRVELIVEALSQISDRKIRWIHFGDGPNLVDIMKLAKEKLDNKNNIRYDFKGYTETEQIMKFYEENIVGAFITTTESEGCPVSVQEAMAYGIPIIGTSVAEIPYMIRGNGVLLNEKPTIEEISKAIEYIFDLGPEEYGMMRQKSKKLWQENFNGELNAKLFVEYLKQL